MTQQQILDELTLLEALSQESLKISQEVHQRCYMLRKSLGSTTKAQAPKGTKSPAEIYRMIDKTRSRIMSKATKL